MNIIYIENHLNASLITECKEPIANYIACAELFKSMSYLCSVEVEFM